MAQGQQYVLITLSSVLFFLILLKVSFIFKKDIKNSNLKSFENKQYIVQKLWRSYNFALDYKTVQLEAFLKNENKFI